MSSKIAYVVHPVTAEDKQAIREQGYKIIDAAFMPEGAEVYGVKVEPAKMKVGELREHLKALGIEFDESAPKPDLLKLLTQE